MPQLNPLPWLKTLAYAWLLFIALLPSKVVLYTYPKDLSTKTLEIPKTEPWRWLPR